MVMQIEVRTITDDEVAAWSGAVNTGLMNPGGEIDAEARRPGLYLDRTWAGFDGGRVVSTLRSFPTKMTVPGGGSIDVAALTAVTTTSTHRRRGLASRMVLGDLAGAKERGEAASILIAAEWPIYGRFGYGAATEHQSATVNIKAAKLSRMSAGRTDYVDAATARAVAPLVFEAGRSRFAGEIFRPDRFWDIDFGIIRYPSWTEPKPGFFVQALDQNDTPVGLIRFQYNRGDSNSRLLTGEITVQMFYFAHDQAEALLWSHLLSLDMVTTIRVGDRPARDLLPWLLLDARQVEYTHRADFLWVRPLDVPGMLTARRYSTAGRIVVEVVDPAGFAAGRFALDMTPDGATCALTQESADLTVSAGVLGSLYLGAFAMSDLHAAGLVDEHTSGAIGRADVLFRSAERTYCSTWF